MITNVMHEFQVLFDHGEGSESLDPAMSRYGKLGFPAPAAARPWIYANLVQTLDGIVSLLGDEAGGADIGGAARGSLADGPAAGSRRRGDVGDGNAARGAEDGTPSKPRGPVFRIMDAGMQQLRTRLRRGRERNVLVTARADFQMSDYAVFDGEQVDVTVVTTREGAGQAGVHSTTLIPGWTSLPWTRRPAARAWICGRRWPHCRSATGSTTCSARADRRCIRACLRQS